MDERTFDARVRGLACAASRRSVLGALAALLAGGIAVDADAKRRRTCRRTSPAGQCCKSDGSCTCTNGGTVCGANCCGSGERCEDGVCVTDAGLACRVLGSTCKASGRACCEGLVCGSGQGGQGDVACYTPTGGACERTEDCVFGSGCVDGTCVATPQPQPEPTCDTECCADSDCSGSAQTCEQGRCTNTCFEPGPASSYADSCRPGAFACTPAGNILTAECEMADGDTLKTTSINVNDCAADNFEIANCNGTLTCGGCG